jgi:hypothetical protein
LRVRLAPPVRFLVGPFECDGGDDDDGLEWSGTGGAGEGAEAGVEAGVKLKLKDTCGADGAAGFAVKLKDACWGAGTGGATLLLLGVELTPAVATFGPAGGFQLGSSQGASAALASR